MVIFVTDSMMSSLRTRNEMERGERAREARVSSTDSANARRRALPHVVREARRRRRREIRARAPVSRSAPGEPGEGKKMKNSVRGTIRRRREARGERDVRVEEVVSEGGGQLLAHR
jgi:hypothetical protein